MFRVALILAMTVPSLAAGQSVFKQTPLSSSASTPFKIIDLHAKDVAPQCPTPWRMTTRLLHGGKQEGTQLLTIHNGKIEILLAVTRGMGVQSVTSASTRLGWDSPVKEIVHPQFMNLPARGGLGWLEGFNEWMCRCGLENNGQAGADTLITNTGDTASIDLTLHGKIANLPASEVEIIAEQSAPFRIHVIGKVYEKMVFGPKLELHTKLTTEPGSNSFTISDEIVNPSGQPQEFQMLYHANFGKPILQEGARFVAPVSQVTPYNARAAKDVKTWNDYLAPTPGYVEQVYLLKPFADLTGKTTVLLHDKAAKTGAAMTYSLKELPYLTLWKNTGAEADGYVTGIEPGTNYPNKRVIERKAGRVPVLPAGGKYAMTIEYEVLDSVESVARIARRIADIQGNRGIQLDERPAN